MILKVIDTDKFNISMTICVDWEDKEINIHVTDHNKKTGTIHGYGYPADEFSRAISKFEMIEKEYTS